MSELARQVAHYAAVRARLNGPSPAAVVLRLPSAAAEAPPVAALPKAPQAALALNTLTVPSWRFIVRLVALRTGVSVADILGETRRRDVVCARHQAMALVYQHTQASMPKVGRYFAKDHTSVLHALRKHGVDRKLVDLLPRPAKAARPKKVIGPTVLQKAIRRAYRHQVPPSVVAEEYGCSPKSVKVIAHRMGLSRSKSKADWVAAP